MKSLGIIIDLTTPDQNIIGWKLIDEEGNDVRLWTSVNKGHFPKLKMEVYDFKSEEQMNSFIEEVIVGRFGYVEIPTMRMQTFSEVKPEPLGDEEE